MTKKTYKYKKHKNKDNKFIKSPIFNQMKNKQCHTFGTIPKSRLKIFRYEQKNIRWLGILTGV
jgi:hypothetical protein